MGAAARMSAAVVGKINIDEVQKMYKVANTETAKYAQPCSGGVYMGVVNVFLGHFCEGDVKVRGDGRMYRCLPGATQAPYGKKPDVCKYHKLRATDKPPKNAPVKIRFEFDVYLYNNSVDVYDKDMEKKFPSHYTLHKCNVDLDRGACLDQGPEGDGYFHEYTFTDVKCDENVKERITSLVKKNRYTFEFQRLNAHRSMPGLYLAESVGHPSDQLAVLFGGRARNKSDANKDLFFAQHKFDTTEWDKMKIIHTAMANVLSKIEYMYNDVSEEYTAHNTETREFCQKILDHVTEPYIDKVLENMHFPTAHQDAMRSISHIRGVCEYVFHREYPFLDASMWTHANGAFAYGSTTMDLQQLASESETRALAYTVLSTCIEPEYSSASVFVNSRLDPQKFNAFSAHDVFKAYLSFTYKNGVGQPEEFKDVLEDARQLVLNMKRLKTSSNFALARLQKSCEAAVKVNNAFTYTRNCMLAASRHLISLLLQKNPSTLDDKFGEYVKTLTWKLRKNPTIENDEYNDEHPNFEFLESISWSKGSMTSTKFECLLFSTQLHVLTGMRELEEMEGEASDFCGKNYFQFQIE